MSFKDFLKKKTDDLTKIDGFADDLAKQILWSQVKKRSGSAFKTHYAIVDNQSLLRFKRSFFMKFLPWLVIFFSFVLMYVFNDFNFDFSTYTFYNSDQYFKAGVVVFLFLLGIITMIFSSRHIVFDRRIGFYHKGFKPLGDSYPREGKNCARLNNIHAVQVISEIIRSKNSRYRSYELNLVLNDGKRINVIDHANQEAVRKDAALVSKFLEIPVWDVTI